MQGLPGPSLIDKMGERGGERAILGKEKRGDGSWVDGRRGGEARDNEGRQQSERR